MTLLDLPISATFGLFEDFEVIDPDGFEEDIIDDTVTVILGDKGKVLSIIKPGGKAVKEELIMLLRAKASDRYNTIYEELEKFKASLSSQMETEYSVCFHEMSKNP